MPMMHLNAFSQCCPISQNIGQWKNPNDKMSDGYLDVEVWVEMAKTLERGCFDAFFLADIHGLYDGYGGTWEAAVQYAVQAPGLDPIPLIPAMSMATKHIGFAVTLQHHLSRALRVRQSLHIARPLHQGPHRLERRHVVRQEHAGQRPWRVSAA